MQTQLVSTAMHKAKKRFGQNFLKDDFIIERILAAIRVQANEHVLEIGPGLGALTQTLFLQSNLLNVIEIDRDLISGLKRNFETLTTQNPNKTQEQWQVINQDALEFNLSSIFKEKKIRVVGNLPYNISTPLLFHFIEQLDYIHDMHFMLQKEVVDRICAKPNNKSYGRLSIMLQYYCECENLFEVPPESFDPQPKVNSAIIRLKPYQTLPITCKDTQLLSKLVTQAFSQRRKTLRNNLKKLAIDEAIEQSGIDTSLRPENIAVADYVKLCNIMSNSQ